MSSPATITFPGGPVPSGPGSLPDGNYSLVIPAGSITDAAGNAVAAYTSSFFILSSDFNRDRRIDVLDLGTLATYYGRVSGVDFSKGDFNGDGSVNVLDLGNLASNYGKTLPALP